MGTPSPGARSPYLSGFGEGDRDSACVRFDMLQVNGDLRPIGPQRKTLRPHYADHPRLRKGVFQRQTFEIVETLDAIKVHVVNAHVVTKHVHQSKSWAGDVLLARHA